MSCMNQPSKSNKRKRTVNIGASKKSGITSAKRSPRVFSFLFLQTRCIFLTYFLPYFGFYFCFCFWVRKLFWSTITWVVHANGLKSLSRLPSRSTLKTIMTHHRVAVRSHCGPSLCEFLFCPKKLEKYPKNSRIL